MLLSSYSVCSFFFKLNLNERRNNLGDEPFSEFDLWYFERYSLSDLRKALWEERKFKETL